MNAFEKHGIKHLSPSNLATYRQEPAYWVAKYLFGLKDEGGAKMWVGNAVEAGLKAWLHGTPEQEARPIAMQRFELDAQGEASDDCNAAREEIGPMLSRAIEKVEKRWDSKPLCQVACRHFLDGVEVPLIGFADFIFDDGTVLDLKTTRRMPSEPKPDHAAQVAFYCKSRNGAKGELLYSTTKRGELYALSDDDVAAAFGELTLAARAVRNVLRLAPSKEDAASMFAPNFDHYFWSSDKLKDAAGRIWRAA
jgi:hypothetical protein